MLQGLFPDFSCGSQTHFQRHSIPEWFILSKGQRQSCLNYMRQDALRLKIICKASLAGPLLKIP